MDDLVAQTWQKIQQEAQSMAAQEPMLASFFHSTILNHGDLRSALSFQLANKLDSTTMPAIALREVIELALRSEPNPALGLRGVRLSLAHEALFLTQLRAILRASAYGPVRILVPMVSGREEMLEVRRRLQRAALQLRKQGHEVAVQLALGAMIEVPAAALALESFIDLVDFLSIGTNDLVQYLLAADRNNDALGDLYSPLHPAVLRLLHSVVRVVRARGMPASICGAVVAAKAARGERVINNDNARVDFFMGRYPL